MQAIFKRSLLFRNPSDPNKKAKLVVASSPDIQKVPDWIRSTEEWKHATKDGSVTEVVMRAVSAPKPAEIKPVVEAEQDTEEKPKGNGSKK